MMTVKKKCHGQGDNHGSRVSSDDAIAQADGDDAGEIDAVLEQGPRDDNE